MKDRELLVMSAQSVGVELVFNDGFAGYYKDCGGHVAWIPWHPILDGADAMRLVVHHGMLINRGIVSCRIENGARMLQRSFPAGLPGGVKLDRDMQALCRAIAELAADIAQVSR